MNSVCVTASNEQEEILRTVIKILDAHNKTMPIIKQSITNEVSATQNPATLFRGNSTATKLMSAFTKMTGIFCDCINLTRFSGRSYLVNLIKPLIDEVCTSQLSCEVDSSKVAAGENVDTNTQNLMDYCQKFLDIIMGSVDLCPIPFKVHATFFLCSSIPGNDRAPAKRSYSQIPNSRLCRRSRFYFPSVFLPSHLRTWITGSRNLRANRS